MIEPIPNADEADTAEQARPADGGIEEHRPLPDVLGNNPDADAADIFEQQLSVSSQDDDHPPAADRAVAGLVTGGVFWLAWKPARSQNNGRFVEDLASLNRPYRPDW